MPDSCNGRYVALDPASTLGCGESVAHQQEHRGVPGLPGRVLGFAGGNCSDRGSKAASPPLAVTKLRQFPYCLLSWLPFASGVLGGATALSRMIGDYIGNAAVRAEVDAARADAAVLEPFHWKEPTRPPVPGDSTAPAAIPVRSRLTPSPKNGLRSRSLRIGNAATTGARGHSTELLPMAWLMWCS